MGRYADSDEGSGNVCRAWDSVLSEIPCPRSTTLCRKDCTCSQTPEICEQDRSDDQMTRNKATDPIPALVCSSCSSSILIFLFVSGVYLHSIKRVTLPFISSLPLFFLFTLFDKRKAPLYIHPPTGKGWGVFFMLTQWHISRSIVLPAGVGMFCFLNISRSHPPHRATRSFFSHSSLTFFSLSMSNFLSLSPSTSPLPHHPSL